MVHSKIAIGICMLLSIGMAHANGGGEGDNTGCNGQGNPNSPCEGSDNGNSGNNSDNGGGYSSNDNVTYNNNLGGDRNTYSNRQDQSQSQGITYINKGSDLSKRVPNSHAPSTNNSYNAYSCLKGASGGISISGFGGSIGGYTLDKNCDIRVTSSILMDYGLDEHAIQVLCALPDMREADRQVAEMRGTEPRCHTAPEKAKKKVSNDHDFW